MFIKHQIQMFTALFLSHSELHSMLHIQCEQICPYICYVVISQNACSGYCNKCTSKYELLSHSCKSSHNASTSELRSPPKSPKNPQSVLLGLHDSFNISSFQAVHIVSNKKPHSNLACFLNLQIYFGNRHMSRRPNHKLKHLAHDFEAHILRCWENANRFILS